jgi:hypothetical protein
MVGDRIQIKTFANQFKYEHNLRKEREYKEIKTLIMPSVDVSQYCRLRACQSSKIQAPDSYSVHGSSLSQGCGYYHPVTKNYKGDQETACQDEGGQSPWGAGDCERGSQKRETGPDWISGPGRDYYGFWFDIRGCV